jgi:hypothetical protein
MWRRYICVSTLAFSTFIDQATVTAFAAAPKPSSTLSRNIQTIKTFNPQDIFQVRGKTAMKSTTSTNSPPLPPAKKLRITAFDGARFLLCTHIVMGHFLRFANPPEFWLKFFAQVNISAGAFFALSGYVTAYTSTEVGQRAASPKLTNAPAQKWWLQKIMSYYPMHWLVLILFSPMFVYNDVTVAGWPTAILNGIMSATLTQAWAPMHAEVWYVIVYHDPL